MACRGRWLRRRLDRGLRPAAGRRRAACGSCRASPMCWPRRSGPRSWRSTCRSACPSGSAPAAGRPRTACGRCSAPASRRCSRCRRAPRSMPPTTARPAAIAQTTSEPPRKVSKQLFNIAPKIREVDEALRADPDAAGRVFEVHPELAFWRLNGERPLTEPKKVKSRPYEPGLALRRGLLIAAGFSGERRERRAAQRRGGRRSARCAGLRRHRAADSCRPRPAVSQPAAARCVRTGDGNLGMTFARNSP